MENMNLWKQFLTSQFYSTLILVFFGTVYLDYQVQKVSDFHRMLQDPGLERLQVMAVKEYEDVFEGEDGPVNFAIIQVS
jgi:hypothetical protein